MWEASGCGRLGRERFREASGCFIKIMKKKIFFEVKFWGGNLFGGRLVLGEASGCGRLVGAGG